MDIVDVRHSWSSHSFSIPVGPPGGPGIPGLNVLSTRMKGPASREEQPAGGSKYWRKFMLFSMSFYLSIVLPAYPAELTLWHTQPLHLYCQLYHSMRSRHWWVSVCDVQRSEVIHLGVLPLGINLTNALLHFVCSVSSSLSSRGSGDFQSGRMCSVIWSHSACGSTQKPVFMTLSSLGVGLHAIIHYQNV